MNLHRSRLTVFVASVLCLSCCRAFAADTGCPTIGIDLGTTYSVVGIYQNGRVEIMANEQGKRITPSYVAFTPDGERLVGDAAKNQASSNPKNTLFDAKRLIGRRYKDSSVQHDKDLLPFDIEQGNHSKPLLVTEDGHRFHPEEVSAMVLQKMKEIAEKFLGKPVRNAVVTVPAYFNDAQRQATKDAATIAGLNVARIINEPTAAAIAYGLDRNAKEKNVLVYDLGGGTFDVSLLTIDEGVFEVLATSGDTHLGGEDFDQRIISHLLQVFKKNYGIDFKGNDRALAKIRREAEKAKRALSTVLQTRVEMEVDGQDLSYVLSRAKFEELNQDLFKKTLKPLAKVLEDAKLKKHEIDEVLLVGGSTRIPFVQKMISDYFNGKKLNFGVNPDEAVAYGAAVQGGVMCSADDKVENVVILDVTPLSLGIETAGGIMSTLVPRGTVVPTKKTQVFSTAQDNQPSVLIQVFQGERSLTAKNVHLGKFELSGIAPAPRGVPQIEVTFEIDANMILSVHAQDLATKKSHKIEISPDSGGLSQQDIERMIKDAEEFAEEDKLHKQRVDALNDLEGYAYSLKSQVKDEQSLGGKLSEADKTELQQAADTTLAWVDSHKDASADELKERKAELEGVVASLLQRAHPSGTEGADSIDEDGEDEL